MNAHAQEALSSRADAKKSAELVAALRALACLERDPKVRGSDDLARHFLSESLLQFLKAPEKFKQVAESMKPGSYGNQIVRTRHFDAILENELANGLPQLVLIAAGNDTRPYRFEAALKDTAIFELDLPATQAAKRAALARWQGAEPRHVRFVAADLSGDEWPQLLAAAGYEARRRTLFLCEGISYYLKPAVIDRLLGFITQACAGTAVTFDYSLRAFIEGDHSSYGSRELAALLEKLGEPFSFGLDADESEAFLRQRGLDVVRDEGPNELEARYLTQSDGQLLCRMSGNMRIVHALVC